MAETQEGSSSSNLPPPPPTPPPPTHRTAPSSMHPPTPRASPRPQDAQLPPETKVLNLIALRSLAILGVDFHHWPAVSFHTKPSGARDTVIQRRVPTVNLAPEFGGPIILSEPRSQRSELNRTQQVNDDEATSPAAAGTPAVEHLFGVDLASLLVQRLAEAAARPGSPVGASPRRAPPEAWWAWGVPSIRAAALSAIFPHSDDEGYDEEPMAPIEWGAGGSFTVREGPGRVREFSFSPPLSVDEVEYIKTTIAERLERQRAQQLQWASSMAAPRSLQGGDRDREHLSSLTSSFAELAADLQAAHIAQPLTSPGVDRPERLLRAPSQVAHTPSTGSPRASFESVRFNDLDTGAEATPPVRYRELDQERGRDTQNHYESVRQRVGEWAASTREAVSRRASVELSRTFSDLRDRDSHTRDRDSRDRDARDARDAESRASRELNRHNTEPLRHNTEPLRSSITERRTSMSRRSQPPPTPTAAMEKARSPSPERRVAIRPESPTPIASPRPRRGTLTLMNIGAAIGLVRDKDRDKDKK